MKLSSTVMLVLLVSFVFVAWGLLIQDFETNYIDTNISSATTINETLYLQDFDNSEELNATMQPILKGFEVIETKDGFFDRLFDFAVIIPLAIIRLPGVLFEQLVLLISLISRFSKLIGIKPEIVGIATIGMFMFILFKLVAFWRRTPV